MQQDAPVTLSLGELLLVEVFQNFDRHISPDTTGVSKIGHLEETVVGLGGKLVRNLLERFKRRRRDESGLGDPRHKTEPANAQQ